MRTRVQLSVFAISIFGLAATAVAAGTPMWSSSTFPISWIDATDPTDVPPGTANASPQTSKVYLYFNGAAPFSTPCSNGSSSAWRVGGTVDNVKNVLALATSAKLAGRQVKVLWMSGATNAQCENGGATGYPVVSGIEVQ